MAKLGRAGAPLGGSPRPPSVETKGPLSGAVAIPTLGKMTAESPIKTPVTPTTPGPEAVPAPPPSPALLFDTINAYQKTAAIKAAIELDVFTGLADTPATAATLAARCQASPRGLRILCDYLVILGFLTKSGDRYALTADSAVFLNRNSPAYAGGTIEFLLSNEVRGAFDHLAAAARRGGTAQSEHGTVAPDHPVWLSFARSMGPLMTPAAAGLAELVGLDPDRPAKVLDISASHGRWGLAFAVRNPKTKIVALDWPGVLEVTRENASAAGLADQVSTIAGSAFEVEFGSDYDAVLVPNFLHHFNPQDCVRFLKKAHAALRPGGAIAIAEFVPNADRVTPPPAASFSLVMLATTPEGDAYTFAEYQAMLTQAGFRDAALHPLPPTPQSAVIAEKQA